MDTAFSIVQLFLVVATSAITIVASIWTFISYSGRPRFHLGSPPNLQERDIEEIDERHVGRKSIISQFRHSNDCLAIQLRDKQELTPVDLNKLYSDKYRTRKIVLDESNRVSLPVIIENYGRRTAHEYRFSIGIYTPKVHIVNVIPESLVFDSIYATRPDLIENDSLDVADQRIVDAYDNYMEIGDQYGDMVFFYGDLEGGMYEMILLDLFVEDGVDNFVIGYFTDCSDFWLSRKAYFQGVKIKK